MTKKFDIKNHSLVPKHTKISEKDKKELLEKYGVHLRNLPKISIKDPAIHDLSPKAGDIIKITRQSPTAGTAIYYRGVTNE